MRHGPRRRRPDRRPPFRGSWHARASAGGAASLHGSLASIASHRPGETAATSASMASSSSSTQRRGTLGRSNLGCSPSHSAPYCAHVVVATGAGTRPVPGMGRTPSPPGRISRGVLSVGGDPRTLNQSHGRVTGVRGPASGGNRRQRLKTKLVSMTQPAPPAPPRKP